MAERDEGAAAADAAAAGAPHDERAEFETWLMYRVRAGREKVADLVGKLSGAEDPSYVLRWGVDGAIEAAARIAVCSQVLAAIAKIGEPASRVTIETIRTYALREALRRAESEPRSTSPTHDEIERATTSAWAEVARFLRGEAL